MDRRNFIRLATAGSAAGLIAPGALLAATGHGMAGGVYYTSEAPGRWAKKVSPHLPRIEVARDGAVRSIQVVTAHEMKAHAHYIVKHMLLDRNYRFLDEHLFDPIEDKTAVSEFQLGEYSGPIHVLSVCNKHDTWLNRIEV